MHPIRPLIIEFPIGMTVALLKAVVRAHADVDWYGVALHIGEMVFCARKVRRISVNGEDGAGHVVMHSHVFQNRSVRRQDRAKLGVTVVARN
jgi:hypothetical protein